MNPQFQARTPWSADRPKTLVVCCSDGRWHAQIMEFVHHEVSRHADLYAVPGGPAVLDPWNSTFDEARVFENAMRLFAEHHAISGVWLIAHEGCAWYRAKHPHLEGPALRARQIDDLHRGRVVMLERHPRYDVRLVFASRREEEVVFDVTGSAPEKTRP